MPIAAATDPTIQFNESIPIELKSSLGHWFLVARIPTFFENGTQRVTVTHTQLSSNRFTMKIGYDRGSFERRTEWSMQSWFDDPGIYRQLQKRFLGPITLKSVVVQLDSATLLLRSPDSRHLWMLSRRHQVSADQVITFIALVDHYGNDATKIEWVAQLP